MLLILCQNKTTQCILDRSAICRMNSKYQLHDTISFVWGCVTFREYFTGKGALPTNHCGCEKTRVIVLSCCIKIPAVHYLVLSQYMHLTDKQTDGQNCDSNTMHCTTCSRTVKTMKRLKFFKVNKAYTQMHFNLTLHTCLQDD